MMRSGAGWEMSAGRAPQGARGLKYLGGLGVLGNVKVAPRKGRVD